MPYPINPDRTKPWNNLPPLPIDETCWKTIPVLEALSNASTSLGKLYGRAVAIPDQSLFINSLSLQEAKDSSEVENIFTTNDELYQAFSSDKNEHLITGPAKEVLRYREALMQGLDILHTHENQFNSRYFIQLYQTVKNMRNGFRPPESTVYIQKGGTSFNSGQAIYTPPRMKGVIEDRILNLIEFINDDVTYPIHPLIKMAVCHYQFEVIHPFSDGNGRVGRLFNSHIIIQKGLLEQPLLYMSRYILRHKNDYYYYLGAVSQQGNWQDWIIFMLNMVRYAAEDVLDRINEIIALRNKLVPHLQKMKDPEKLASLLFSQPYTTVKFIVQNGYAENTARKYLDEISKELPQLFELHILKGNNHYYLNKQLIEILSR